MPVLNIGGKRVTVDDSFLKLTPDQQNDTVDEIAKTMGAAPQPKLDQPTVKATVETPPDPRDSVLGKVDTFVRGAADTLSFGLADEAAAAGDAALNPVFGNGNAGESFSDRYNANLAAQRGTDQADATNRPVARIAGQLAGGVTGGAGLAKSGLSMTANAVNNGSKLLQVAKASAAEGALMGAGQGFGSGEGGFLGRLANSGESAAVGAGMGAVAPYAVAGTGSFLKSLAAPVMSRLNPTPAANRALGTALQRSGRTPDEIAGMLRSAADDGQGGYAVADALGHTGQRMLSSVARTPNDARQDVVTQLLDRQMGQGDRLSNALAEGFGASDTAAQRATALTDVRTADARQNYGAARQSAGSVNVTPILEEIDRTLTPGVNGIVNPRDNINNDSIEGALSRVRGMIADGRGSQVTDFSTLFRAKLDLDDMIQKATNQGAGNRAFALTQVKTRLDRALADASPEYRNANDTFARQSGVIDSIADGATATSGRARAPDNIADFNSRTPDQQDAFRVGYGDQLIGRVEAASASPTTNKTRMLNTPKYQQEFPAIAIPEQADQLGRRVGREQRMFETTNQALGGSRTADNLADMDEMKSFDPAILSNLFKGDFKTAALQAVMRTLNEGKGMPPSVIERVGRGLMETDPEAARRLLTVASSKTMNDTAKRGMATVILNGLTTAAPPRILGQDARPPLEITVGVPRR
ncbi:hypothetical protein [Rhizobium tumorigenes]|uniref:Uncharacterized protein n=1 Tax=Rhizobium tumorigenes TaxID=2041385 RepID=A0AAF1KAK3_9HYPH|nr:hypothetical protein [Rhizobium tumorigenes]WFR98720.1 hypothetical protein PR017_23760 [Rhizobium tumorigenes]